MRSHKRAFTLVEILVVLAVMLVLAGLLYPVFAVAKGTAYRMTCLSNFHQVSLAAKLYMNDYDDRFMPVNEQPADPPNSRNDRTWVQLTLPYLKHFSLFKCPSDTSERPRAEASFDSDLVPGDTDSQYYTASMRSNVGYNYDYLAPIYRSGFDWVADTRLSSAVTYPSSTILFADSVWSVLPNGQPFGGGNWLIVPPCRYYSESSSSSSAKLVDSFLSPSTSKAPLYTTAVGWAETSSDSTAPAYGGAWPWHLGRVNVAMVDGSVQSRTPSQLTAGCDMKDAWKGVIFDSYAYPWDLK